MLVTLLQLVEKDKRCIERYNITVLRYNVALLEVHVRGC